MAPWIAPPGRGINNLPVVVRRATLTSLNRMLEAERAGAKALVVFMDAHPRHGEAWTVLRGIQNDEAHNCALIGRLLESRGAPYSHATGEFYEEGGGRAGQARAHRVPGPRAQVGGQALRGSATALTPDARDVFTKMRDSHLRSIDACERVIKAL